MEGLKNMPVAGLAVIVIIALLFVLSVILLFVVYGRYRRLADLVSGDLDRDSSFLRYVVNEYAAAFKLYGQDVNTPALISEAVSSKLSGMLLCERKEQ